MTHKSSQRPTTTGSTLRALGRVAFLILFSACGNSCSRQAPFAETDVPAMGTVMALTVPSGSDEDLRIAVHLTRRVTTRLQKLFDPSDPGSELTQINTLGRSVRIPVSRETRRLLDLAVRYGKLSNGAFDITVAPIALLWGFGGGRVPREPLSDSFLYAASKAVGLDLLQLDGERIVHLTSPHAELTLNDIVDAFTVDLCIQELRKEGFANVLVNLGGSTIRGLGRAGPDKDWEVPLYVPGGVGSKMGVLHLRDAYALAMSDLYSDFVTIGGVRYGHVIDPRTGRPAQGTASVSVVGPTATEAKALSMALIVLGVEHGPEILAAFPRCHALIIPDREPLELWMTSSFDNYFDVDPAYRAQVRFVTTPAAQEEQLEHVGDS